LGKNTKSTRRVKRDFGEVLNHDFTKIAYLEMIFSSGKHYYRLINEGKLGGELIF